MSCRVLPHPAASSGRCRHRTCRAGRRRRGILARSRSRGARCPRCGRVSARVHRRYERIVADTAIGGQPVALRMLVRRLFCDTSDCPARTFAEQVAGVTERYARRSVLLRRMLESIGLALAGRAGARLAIKLGVPVSRHTLGWSARCPTRPRRGGAGAWRRRVRSTPRLQPGVTQRPCRRWPDPPCPVRRGGRLYLPTDRLDPEAVAIRID